MNFSGGSAALVATFKITIEHCLHLCNRIGHFNALALLRVARNPSSVGCPTPNTGNPFTWIRNKRVQLKIHKVYQIHQQGNKSLLKPLNLHLFTKSSPNLWNQFYLKSVNSLKSMKTCLKLAAPSSFSTSSGKRCIPATTNIVQNIANIPHSIGPKEICISIVSIHNVKCDYLKYWPSKKSALTGKSVRSKQGAGAWTKICWKSK